MASKRSYGLTDDLLLSLGYNFNELRNRNFEDETLGKGFYLRVRFKFDEDLLNRVSGVPEGTSRKQRQTIRPR